MTQSHVSDPAPVWPPINGYTLWTLLLAGAMSTAAFDLFGQSLSPMFGQSQLAPVGLARGVISTIFGSSTGAQGYLLHYIAGMIGYPIGWMFIFRPLSLKLAPSLPLYVTAIVYGIALWVFALYFMASLIAGNPPFLNFGNITWVALVGHIVFALVTAAMVGWRESTRTS